MFVVYVVCKGERGEGHTPLAVRTTWAGAVWVARRQAPVGHQIRWHIEEGVWIATLPNGTDQVAIYRFHTEV